MNTTTGYPVKWITDRLAGGYAPRSDADLDGIRDSGIGAILNLCAECYDLHEIEQRRGFDVYFLPIADESAPTPSELRQAVSWMAACMASGKKVLVHCRFGVGRTGTLMTAYLMSTGMGMRAALRQLRHTPAYPNTTVQRRVLDDYARQLNVDTGGIDGAAASERGKSGGFFDRIKAMGDWFA